MKRIILVVAMWTTVNRTEAQVYSFTSKRLVDQYASIYNKTDPKENFYVRMNAAANNFFLVDNEIVYEAISEVQKKYRISVDSSVNIIFDTLILHFSQHYIWGENSNLRDKFLSFFEMYNSKICPCVTEKIQMSPRKFLDEAGMNDCVAKLIKDTGYVNETKRLLGHLTLNELNNLSQLSGIYIFQHCSAMYRYFSESIRYESVYTLLGRIKTLVSQLDNTLTKLYRSNSPELLKNFPTYKKFEPDLKLAAGLLNNKKVIRFSDRSENADGSIAMTNTYYSYTKDKPLLHGQIVYIVGDPLYASSVTSFRFIVPAKMKDREKYMKMIEENDMLQPPPPMEELKEVIIDTLKK